MGNQLSRCHGGPCCPQALEIMHLQNRGARGRTLLSMGLVESRNCKLNSSILPTYSRAVVGRTVQGIAKGTIGFVVILFWTCCALWRTSD
jgi:hypothetical protein